MSNVIGEYKDKLNVHGRFRDIHIQIVSVPNQKNKIVMTGHHNKKPSVWNKKINGSLLGFKKLIHDEKSLGWKFNPKIRFSVSIHFQNRGSHQGGPSHNYKDTIAVFSKDENTIDKLLQFLQKYITKGKVKRTKRKTKRRTIKKGRKGPEESATKFSVGTIKPGNDGNMWVINVSKNGVQRWVKSQKGGMEASGLGQCSVCLNNLELIKPYKCDHGICSSCHTEWMGQQEASHDMKTTCPQCRTPHSDIYCQAAGITEAQWQAQQAEQQAQAEQTTCLDCSIRGFIDNHHKDECPNNEQEDE